MSNTSVGDLILVFIAVVAFAVAVVLAMAPGVLPPGIVDAVETVETALEPELVVLAIGGLIGLFALWRSFASGGSDVTTVPPSVEPVRDRPVGVVGQAFTDRVEYIVTSLERGRDVDTGPVRTDLQQAVIAIETARGRSVEEATNRIDRGVWTDDQIAAAFLGDGSAGRLSFWHRLRRWLFPARTFERRLERTLTEIERYADDRRGDH